VETAETICKWADEAFGPVKDYKAAGERAAKEMLELIEETLKSPTHLTYDAAFEAADVCIVLMRMVQAGGYSFQAVLDSKMRVNRDRRWVPDGTGHGQHLKEGTDAV
jgi:hypothetical protein